MTSLDKLHKKWLIKKPAYKQAYDELDAEFDVVAALIKARARAGVTQKEVARRMKTTQTVVARLEGGRTSPSMRTLSRFAQATGTKLKITFEPDKSSSRHVTA